MIKLTFLGTSSGVPTRQRNVSGLAVQTALGPEWYLVDCGEGTQHQLQKTPLSLHQMAAICITHVHGDHCYGLPGLLASAGMAKRTRPLVLMAPLPVWQWWQATQQLTDLHLPYEVTHVDVASNLLVHSAPGLRIERHALEHRVPSYAYRLQVQTQRTQLKSQALKATGLPPGPAWGALQNGEDVPWGGQVLRSADWVEHITHTACAVVGGDNANPALLATACQGAQVLVHEATYTQAVLDHVGPGPMHSSAQKVATFAQTAQLPNLILTHLSARHHTEQGAAELMAEAQAHYSGRAWLASDLQTYELDNAGNIRMTTTPLEKTP